MQIGRELKEVGNRIVGDLWDASWGIYVCGKSHSGGHSQHCKAKLHVNLLAIRYDITIWPCLTPNHSKYRIVTLEVHMISRSIRLAVPALTVALAASFSITAQTPVSTKPAASKAWTAPRTPDGKPDLQGIWNSATLTPFERPKEYAGKEFFTPQEAAAFTKDELYRVDGDRRDGGGGADVGRAYNEFWRERGGLSPDLRTSMVIDPPDGRIPPLTPQAQKMVAQRRDANRGHEFDGPENRG